jgi:lipoate-protein ligase A
MGHNRSVSRAVPVPAPRHLPEKIGDWIIEVRQGDAGTLHEADLLAAEADGDLRRRVVVQVVDSNAWVLGSAQSFDAVSPIVRADSESGRGPSVVRRRSGGGLVPLHVNGQVWIDVVIPVGDPLWTDDVVVAAEWVGEWWAEMLRTGPAALSDVTVHNGPLKDRELGALVCFGAIGPGEVTVAGKKVVGISQRRTRLGVRFQCVAPLRWSPEETISALNLPSLESGASGSAQLVEALSTALTQHAGAVPNDPDADPGGWSIVERLLALLP